MVFSPKGREAKWKTQVDNTAKNSTLGGRAVVTKAVISLQDLRARGKAESSCALGDCTAMLACFSQVRSLLEGLQSDLCPVADLGVAAS